MAVIKYKNNQGQWKPLTETINITENTDEVHVGDYEPIGPACKVWYDTTMPAVPVVKCKTASGDWINTAAAATSWNDLKDRPFGLEDVTLIEVPAEVYTYTRINSVPVEALDGRVFSYIKVAEALTSIEDLYGAVVSLNYEAAGTTLDLAINPSDVIELNNGYGVLKTDNTELFPLCMNIYSAGTVVFPMQDGINIVIEEVAEPGLYLLYVEGLARVTTYQRIGTVKSIEDRFIPDSIARQETFNNYYTKNEVDTGLAGKQDNIEQYVESVNGKSGIAVLTAEDVGALPNTTVIPVVPTDISAFTNDSKYTTETFVSTKLADYYTKTQIDQLIAGINNSISELQNLLGNSNTVLSSIETIVGGGA